MLLHTHNELHEKEIKKKLCNSIKNNKTLRNKFTKRWNISALKNKRLIKEDTNKWKISHVHDLEELRSLKGQY